MIWGWIMLLLPIIGALGVVVSSGRAARSLALWTSLATFGASIVAAVNFGVWGTGEFGLVSSIPWMSEVGISISIGADSVSMMLVLLTTFLMPLAVLGSWTAVNERLKEYYGWLLLIETAMIGVFLARDLVFFYVCFEFTLVPMYFLIAIYGGSGRARACVKFFLYTFTGSLIALVGFLYVAWSNMESTGQWSFDIATLTTFAAGMPLADQLWILTALVIGFAVKIPLFPVHTWLPLAHTEAPTAGSVILAGVLLKLGTYGLYRFALPMTPDAVVEWAPILGILSIVGILYAGLICWVQTDVKKLVAYSSVSHLGFCVLGIFALNPMGLQGSVLYMINHGLSTGALFFLVGMMYERYHTRDMDSIGGLAKRMPIWAFFMVFFVLASVGLPGLNGFVSEFLCLLGTFAAGESGSYPGVLGPWFAAFAALGMIVAAMYLLIMVGKIVFGSLKEPAGTDRHGLSVDLNAREITVLVPLAVLCILLGVQPWIAMDAMDGSVVEILSVYQPSEVAQQMVDAGSAWGAGSPSP